MNRNLRALRHRLTCRLAVLGLGAGIGMGQALAQMPVPLLDAATPADAGRQLEAMLQCKAGTMLMTDEVETKLRAIGMAKGADGFMLPTPKGPRPSLFGSEVVAALVTTGEW